jgi:hypothetical protein
MNSQPALPSDRSFGLLFVVIFAAVALWGLWRAASWAWWPAAAALLTLAASLARPHWLRPLNRKWMQLAELLHRIVSPLVLGLIYFALFTPVAYAMRLGGRDALQRRFDPAARTYWIERSPPGPDPKSLPEQF